MQGTPDWSLVQDNPTCYRAANPVHHNYWTSTLDPMSHNYWAHALWVLQLVLLEPGVSCKKRSHCNEQLATTTKSSPHSLQLEKACVQQRRLTTAKRGKDQRAEFQSWKSKHRHSLIQVGPMNIKHITFVPISPRYEGPKRGTSWGDHIHPHFLFVVIAFLGKKCSWET